MIRILTNILSYIISGFLIYACNDINKQLISSAETDNTLEMLGFGLSKIILIPILIILYLLLISCVWITLFNSIKLIAKKTKLLKVFGIILLLINLFMAGFVIYLIAQFFKAVI